jgi:hypothetical protein
LTLGTLAPDTDFPPPPPALTKRGVWIGIGITLIAIVLAIASVQLRRTRKERTTAFFGQDTILAIESGRQVQLARIRNELASLPPTEGIVELTDLPGLGHFRHALLDDRHYQDTPADTTHEQRMTSVDDWFWLRISHPIPGNPARELLLNISAGEIAVPGRSEKLRFTRRVRAGMENFVRTVYQLNPRGS